MNDLLLALALLLFVSVGYGSMKKVCRIGKRKPKSEWKKGCRHQKDCV